MAMPTWWLGGARGDGLKVKEVEIGYCWWVAWGDRNAQRGGGDAGLSSCIAGMACIREEMREREGG